MNKIKDVIETIVDKAESKMELPVQEILAEAAEISSTATFGLTSLLLKAVRAFQAAIKEEELKMQMQDQLRDRWGENAPDLDVFI